MASPARAPTSSATSQASRERGPPATSGGHAAAGGGALGGFGQSLAQEVEDATAKWMKMISSTFLGESAGSSLFSRRQPAIMADYSQGSDSARTKARRGRGANGSGLDDTRELKIALVGGSAVGKTSIVRRWLQRSYPSQYSPTIGVDVHSLSFKSKPGQAEEEEVLLHLWDVSSAEVDARDSALHSLICEDLDGIFFVFNVHRVSSIAAIDKWRHCLAKYTSAKEIPFFLLSHKADLLQKRVMTSDDIASYARNAGYKGWMWTVGRSNFGENDKHPAVMEALERMVELIVNARDLAEQARASRDSASQGIFASRTSVPLEVVQTDDALHQFSASLLRIPTQTITTVPRDESHRAVEKEDNEQEEKESVVEQAQRPLRQKGGDNAKAVDYGGNWILGNNKGVYLRATNDSFVANDETEDEVEATDPETYTFPFASEKRLDGEGSEQEQEHEDDEDQEHEGDERKQASGDQVGRRDASDSEDSDDHEQEFDEARLQKEKAAHDRMNDELAWRFFAGSIDRTRTEEILGGKEEGTFLLRRKDAQTLVLSYVGASQIHHVLIEYAQQKYHIGSSKTSQAAFATLWKCLRSVRRYAFRGLIFTRNVDFRVVNKEELSLETGDEGGVDVAQTMPVTPSIWRTRTRSGSSSSLGDSKSGSSSSRHASPTTTTTAGGGGNQKPRLVSGLQANQEQVRVPPKTRIEELSNTFYDQLSERLSHLVATTTQEQEPAGEDSSMDSAASDEVNVLLKMVEQERTELKRAKAGVSDAETQWRQLVKNMESWNRIVMNLELRSLKVL